MNSLGEEQPTLDYLLELCCKAVNVDIDLLPGKCRKRELVQARHLYSYFAWEFTGCPLKQISYHLGGRHHATIYHGNANPFAGAATPSPLRRDPGKWTVCQQFLDRIWCEVLGPGRAQCLFFGHLLNLRGADVDLRYSANVFKTWIQALRSASPSPLMSLNRSANSSKSDVRFSPVSA